MSFSETVAVNIVELRRHPERTPGRRIARAALYAVLIVGGVWTTGLYTPYHGRVEPHPARYVGWAMIAGGLMLKRLLILLALLGAVTCTANAQDTVTVSFDGGFIRLPGVVVVTPDTVEIPVPSPPDTVEVCPEGWTCTPPTEPLDTIPPPPLVLAPQIAVVDSTATVSWEYEEVEPTWFYVRAGLDAGGWYEEQTTLASPVLFTIPGVGDYFVCVETLDAAGNYGSARCNSFTVMEPGDPYDLATDTVVYVPHVTSSDTVRPMRYAQAPVGQGSVLHADSGRTTLPVYIRLERRDGAWELAHGPLPNDTTEAVQIGIAGVDSVKFWLDGEYANRERSYTYEMFPGGSRDPIPLGLGEHTIRYQVWGEQPEARTVTIQVREKP